MTDTRFELVIFSRDVELPEFLPDAKHTGYGLVKYEDGIPVAIKTVEVTASSTYGDMNFANSCDFGSGAPDGWLPLNKELSTGNKIVPSRVFENGAWKDTTAEWVSDREYKTVSLDFSENAARLYQKIENHAAILGASGFSYDPVSQNCNTWAGYIDKQYLGNLGIFNKLNQGVESPDSYLGGDKSFPYPGSEMYVPSIQSLINAFANYLEDLSILKGVDELTAYLNNSDYSWKDVVIDIRNNDGSIVGIIQTSEETITCSFSPKTKKEEIRDIINETMETARNAKSPLVIDLDGDGVETTTSGNGVHFDHDGNGFAEKSGWVGKDDGLLVRDINGNGEIDDGTELFGNNSVLSSGDKAA